MSEQQERFRLGEFWLDRRSDCASDAWQITWYDPLRRQTRQRSTRTSDFERAKTVLAEHYVARGRRQSEPPSSVVLDHVLTRYFEQHAKALPSADFSDYALQYWRRFWGGSTVAEMAPRLKEFTDFVSAGYKRSMKPATVNRILGVGRAALERAIELKEITEIPSIEEVAVPKQLLYRATLPELANLLNATDRLPHVRLWSVASLATLARPATVLEFSRPQFHFDLRRIELLAPWRAPNDKGRPIVPMIDTVVPWLEDCGPGLLVAYRTKKGTRPLKSIRMGFERARDRAGLPEKITPYTIRRTLSTELRRRGVPPWEIAGFLGHSVREFEITEKYAVYSPDYLGKAAATLDAICWELQPLLDFELLRTSRVPVPTSEESQVADKAGRREWDRTTDHHHVNVLILKRKQRLKSA